MEQINDEELYDEFYEMYDLLFEKLVGNVDFAKEFYDGDQAKANKEITNILDYLADIVGYATGHDEDDDNNDETDEGEEGEEGEDDIKKKEDE